MNEKHYTFYRNNYRYAVKALFIAVIVILGLALSAVYIVLTREEPAYYATNLNNTQPIQLQALDNPNLRLQAILEWAEEAATMAYTYGFNDYRERLGSLRTRFTDTGWQQFVKNILQQTGNLSRVQANSLLLTGVPVGTPLVVEAGRVDDGAFAWRIQVPILVAYQDANGTTNQSLIVTMLVRRIPMEVGSDSQGLGISQMIVRKGSVTV